MKLEAIKLDKALNQAYFKQSLKRDDVERFKTNFKRLFERINETESEEHNKNIVSDFLKDTFYKDKYEINTAGRKDLVIHKGNTSSAPAAVIIEAKSPANKAEMISFAKPNAKALHETIHYYLNERIVNQNKEIKHLIITNIYDWFIFDATDFEKHFVQGGSLRKSYQEWTDKELVGTKTEWFYNEIAKPYIESHVESLPCVHVNLLEYATIVKNQDQADDTKLINLYKILSPEHLLKLPFANDYNKIDTGFYNELLHILGLEETKEGGKKLIVRVNEKDRMEGSFMENTLNIIQSRNRLSKIENPTSFGDTEEEQLFSVSLELIITWINRILFLKLLEAQLVKYHNGDKAYEFLNYEKVADFDQLDELFFEVLAKHHKERKPSVQQKYGNLPYLNSSLFEISNLEDTITFIDNLKDRLTLTVSKQTVLKDKQGNRLTGELNTLEYLFAFLNAYSFASDSKAEIQDDNRTIINAAVLGLIFEKINGYKDGSFYTPSFITMYMSRETLRRAVAQKFKELENNQIETFDDVKQYVARYFKKDDIARFNKHINSLKIVDPAVGSGHFLVSALNELICIKSELNILCDTEGKPLEYEVTADNDELTVLHKQTNLPFEYVLGADNQPPKQLQTFQVALFHEKQTLIENCLFGVDINPKSVLICRLRLWIELLKNAYYFTDTDVQAHGGVSQSSVQSHSRASLQTLPNIDINIKCGNSLISRFPLHASVKSALKKSKWSIESYRSAISTYRSTNDKQVKREMEKLILLIKQEFTTEIRINDPTKNRLDKLASELYDRFSGNFIFEPDTPYGKQEKELKKMSDRERKKLEDEINELTIKINEIKSNKIYENAFEWRFEFPEVLDDNGDYIGFDAVIGNPPYIQLQKEGGKLASIFEQMQFETFAKTGDIYSLFYEKGVQLLKNKGLLAYITSNKWMRAGYGKQTRKFFTKFNPIELIDLGSGVFDSATVDTNVLIIEKAANQNQTQALDITKEKDIHSFSQFTDKWIQLRNLTDDSWTIADDLQQSIKQKIERIGTPLKDWDVQINYGIKTGYNEAFIIDGKKKDELIAAHPRSAEIIKPILRGRDIKRYKAEFADLWLIATFPALNIDIEEYPAIKEYLMSFGKRLHQTGEDFIDENGEKAKSRKKTGNKWFETQDQIAYHKEFEKEKIVWKIIGNQMAFLIDDSKLLLNNACYLLTGEKLKYLVSILNSKAITWYSISTNMNKTGVGDVQVGYQNIIQFPIPQLKEIEQQPFIEKVEQILALKEQAEDTTALESEIDQMVYQLYELTPEEIALIESSTR